MRHTSLQLRLVALWCVILVVALGISNYGLQVLFERSLLRRTLDELSLDLVLLAEATQVDASGAVSLSSAPRDPLFQVAYGGRYWQIVRSGEAVLRSPSLWGFVLPLDEAAADTSTKTVRLTGPDDQNLFGVVRKVTPRDAGDRRGELALLVAADYREIVEARERFRDDLLTGTSLVAALLLLAAIGQVFIGLWPLREIQRRLSRVRRGEISRLDGSFPEEVMPLVVETNALLDAQDLAITKSRARAGDLAHGLKTPLAVLAAQSRAIRRRGSSEIADQMDLQIGAINRHVERELSRTRTRGSGRTHHARVETGPAIRRLVGAMQFLPRENELDWRLDLTEGLSAAIDATDFDELMGNLIDNARKWATSSVLVKSRSLDGKSQFVVEDDGPGIPEQKINVILQRGERADPTVDGHGLGLAIVSDILDAYNGRLTITKSALGGVAAVVTLDEKPGA